MENLQSDQIPSILWHQSFCIAKFSFSKAVWDHLYRNALFLPGSKISPNITQLCFHCCTDKAEKGSLLHLPVPHVPCTGKG